MLADDSIGARLERRRIADVEHDRASEGIAARDRARSRVSVAVAKVNDATFVAERRRDCFTDAAARTRDERYLAFELKVHARRC